MTNRFLKLSPGYYLLWAILSIVIASKVYLIRPATASDFYGVGAFAVAMLAVSYLIAWAVWRIKDKQQRTGELTYLAVLTVIFLIRTVLLYSEAIAGR